MAKLLIAVMLLFLVATALDCFAYYILVTEGREPPRWARWVPFADLYFWWMK